MKLGACVVLYKQKPSYLDSFLPFCDEVVIADNGNNPMSGDKIHYISMNGNQGIAAALNAGLEYLESIGCDVVLTMDDDSRFPISDANGILQIIEDKPKEYGIIGLNFNSKTDEKSNSVKDVKYWLTSGNFLDVKAWRDAGGFREDLFIDYVDFEFAYRLKKAGYKVGVLEDYSIQHRIGNPIEFKLLGRTFHAMNHPAIRDYYRYRNARFLAMEDFHFFGKEYLKELLWQYPKMLFFEDDTRAKRTMIRRGIKDAKKGKLGKFEEADS